MLPKFRVTKNFIVHKGIIYSAEDRMFIYKFLKDIISTSLVKWNKIQLKNKHFINRTEPHSLTTLSSLI